MKANFFRGRAAFESAQSYRLLPFRFMRWSDREVFVSNDVGEWLFLSVDTFQEFTAGQLEKCHALYGDLKAKHFLADSSSTLPLRLLATKYRTKKAFLEGFTRLHMFVVTLR